MLVPSKNALIILGIVFFEAFSQTAAQAASVAGDPKRLIFSVLGYSVVSVLLYHLYATRTIGIVNVIWSGLSIVAMLSIGRYYGERCSPIEWFGISMIFAGIFLLSSKREL